MVFTVFRVNYKVYYSWNMFIMYWMGVSPCTCTGWMFPVHKYKSTYAKVISIYKSITKCLCTFTHANYINDMAELVNLTVKVF